jgi:hypothetical protein
MNPHGRVFIEEAARMRTIRPDPSYDRGSMDDEVRTMFRKPGPDRSGIEEIELALARCKERGWILLLDSLPQESSQESAAACEQNSA